MESSIQAAQQTRQVKVSFTGFLKNICQILQKSRFPSKSTNFQTKNSSRLRCRSTRRLEILRSRTEFGSIIVSEVLDSSIFSRFAQDIRLSQALVQSPQIPISKPNQMPISLTETHHKNG
jgi:hypothetical protein